MGVDVFVEDQVHARSYGGPALGEQFSRILMKVGRGGLLSGVDLHGDTMFNTVQLRDLMTELAHVRKVEAGIAADIDNFSDVVQTVIRQRGYIWISGD